MIMCNLQVLLGRIPDGAIGSDLHLPEFKCSTHKGVPYTLIAILDDVHENDIYKQMVQLFDWMTCCTGTGFVTGPNLVYLDTDHSHIKALCARMDLPVWVLSTLNTMTEMMSTVDVTKLSSDLNDIRVGDIAFMSGMYSTVVELIKEVHKNDLFKFDLRDGVEGLANITLPMYVDEVTDEYVIFDLAPYLKPLVPLNKMKFTRSTVANMEPYIKLYRESVDESLSDLWSTGKV